MDSEKAVSAMKAIIAEERRQGCPMAHEFFIEPALRRWRSYDRRKKRNKDKSAKHRVDDLEKGMVEWYVQHYGLLYDPACIGHLAESFAEVLSSSVGDEPEAGKW